MLDIINIAWLPFMGYSLSLIVYILHITEALHTNSAFLGTIMLLIGNALFAIAFATDFIRDPVKKVRDQKITLSRLKRIGAGVISVFLLLSFIGILGLHSKAYDLLGVIGYGLFASAKTVGVYFVIAYLALSIIYKWHLPDERENLQVIGKLCIFTYYMLILLF